MDRKIRNMGNSKNKIFINRYYRDLFKKNYKNDKI